ncbi:hypothetical protein BDV10DRAFT_72377 [Aspergillus recurvatus]
MVDHVSGTPAAMWRSCRPDRELKPGLRLFEPDTHFLANRKKTAVWRARAVRVNIRICTLKANNRTKGMYRSASPASSHRHAWFIPFPSHGIQRYCLKTGSASMVLCCQRTRPSARRSRWSNRKISSHGISANKQTGHDCADERERYGRGLRPRKAACRLSSCTTGSCGCNQPTGPPQSALWARKCQERCVRQRRGLEWNYGQANDQKSESQKAGTPCF